MYKCPIFRGKNTNHYNLLTKTEVKEEIEIDCPDGLIDYNETL